MHFFMVVATVAWFALVGLLWYARPGDLLWFWASVALGALWFTGFFWYVTRPK